MESGASKLDPDPASPQNSVRARIVSGFSAALFGQVVSASIQLAAFPAFVAAWGMKGFGHWLALTSLASFLTLSEMGFATAAANEMAMDAGRGDRKRVVVVYQSMWALLSAISGIALIVGLGVLWLTPFPALLPVEVSLAEIRVIGTALIVGVLSSVLSQLAIAGFRCDGNFAVGSLCFTLQRTSEFIGQAIGALTFRSMIAAAVLGTVFRLAAHAVTMLVLKRYSPWLHAGVRHADGQVLRRLVSPAFASAAMPLGHALNNQGMIQVVAAVAGPAATVAFSAHRTIANIATQLTSIINRVVSPEFARAYGESDIPLQRRLHRQACRYAIWVSALALAFACLTGPWLLQFWTRGKVTCDLALLASLLLAVFMRTTWFTSSVVATSINLHQRLAMLFVFGMGASCLVAVPLTRALGLIGPAVALLGAEMILAGVVLRGSLSLVGDTWRTFLHDVMLPPVPGRRS
ncbi:MAG: hypothetical protein KF688_10880 [Pirellulales bacterium]|nr:hypothetical protein [Pirellulales bacterium]